MPDEKLYCPDFVYQICVGLTVYDFITQEMSLNMVANKYSMSMSEHYKEIVAEELSYPAEEIVRFMSEQKNPKYEAHEKANFFVYYRLKFDGLKGTRKLKGIFKNAFKGDKEKQYDAEKTIKEFKAFTFALRASQIDRAPPGWTLKSENKDEIAQLGEIYAKEFPLDDLL